MGHSFWSTQNLKNGLTPGYVTYDDAQGKNMVVLEPGTILRQFIQLSLEPGIRSQLSFWVKLEGMQKFDLQMKIAIKYSGGDCSKTCSDVITPIATTVIGA